MKNYNALIEVVGIILVKNIIVVGIYNTISFMHNLITGKCEE